MCEQCGALQKIEYILGSWKKYFESKLEKQESQGKNDIDIGLKVGSDGCVTVSQKAPFYEIYDIIHQDSVLLILTSI